MHHFHGSISTSLLCIILFESIKLLQDKHATACKVYVCNMLALEWRPIQFSKNRENRVQSTESIMPICSPQIPLMHASTTYINHTPSNNKSNIGRHQATNRGKLSSNFHYQRVISTSRKKKRSNKHVPVNQFQKLCQLNYAPTRQLIGPLKFIEKKSRVNISPNYAT